jgi:hypothetical protein
MLVVGELGTARAEPFPLRYGELSARLESAAVRASVTIEDRLGDDRQRAFELRFPKLRSFTVDAVVRNTPLLQELLSLTEHVSGKQILPGVERLVGRGRLYRALDQLDRAGDAPTPPSVVREQSLDELLRTAAAAGADREKAAARAVDVFVRAARDRPAPPKLPAVRKPPRAVHAALDLAIRQTASDLLAHPRVAALEGAWRGLKLLCDQLPDNGSVALEVVDARADHELDVLRMREHDPRLARPDVLVLSESSAPLPRLRAYAEHAQRLEAVCIVGLDTKLLGVTGLNALRDREGQQVRQLEALRGDESARWLCLAVNPVLLHSDPMPAEGARLVFGSAAWAVGALLLAAQRGRDRFTRMLGPDTLLKAPTFWVPGRGADAGMALPTLEFCSARAQVDLAELGVTALGSTRRGDEALISRAPTAYAGEAPQSLASQLVIGRIVRAAREARALVLGHEGAATQRALAAQRIAEGVPAGLERIVRLDVSFDHTGKSGRLAIDAACDRFEALSAFQIAFALDC